MSFDEEEEISDEVDPEDPDESDQDKSDDPETIACLFCGKVIDENAEWCHHCGKYISQEDAPASTPGWILTGAILGLIAMTGGTVIWLIVRAFL